MAEGVKTWDMRELTVNFAGMPIESGAAEGSFLRREFPTKAFASQEGADGTLVRYATGSKLVRITISLLRTASGNATLSAIHQIDLKSKNGGGIAPFLYRDRQGLSMMFCEKAWITGWPDAEDAQNVTAREWVIEGFVTEMFEGGN